MGAGDDNSRGSVREKGRLRARGEEASGYSYQDESRVESLRANGRASAPNLGVSQPANDVAPAPATTRVGKSTMVGGFAVGDAAREPAPAAAKKDSWPAMPSIPPELEGAADREAAPDAQASDEALWDRPTDPPKSAQLGGAIWQAVPSVMSSEPPPDQPSEFPPAPLAGRPRSDDIAALVQESAERMSAAAEIPRMSESMRTRISKHQAQYADVRMAKLDPLVERSAWEQVVKELGDERDVTPTIQLLRAMAQRELMPDRDKKAAAVTREAIAALAEILGVPENSPTALLLAKRLLRRNRSPGAVAPSKGLSASVLLAGLAVGAGVGWLITKLFL